ncbi:unnamed protein product (macronuclear) [Paramecium tetraurelia]|uniref:Uncharacterized protein n=1 Tax=Paramecium tetraurelia TaxID=5888 RepID=A0CKZ2_PARTE|nr:uncharacterized protein GSPATT00008006001 [Paramecium tetraurelia]CAK71459.1 unnamed protein product [Paramecium tetraurelia]|eukprot:XP_001438856.1 hypothetical protein (macronuclear) [Paramecium tetraurelia strain d4-2]
MSKVNQELYERAIQIINQDAQIYQKLNATQFDKGLDLFEIYSECYDINVIANNNVQRIITSIDSESKSIYEKEKEFEQNDALIQLQFLLKQIQNQYSSDIRYQKIIAATEELISFIENHSDLCKRFRIQSDQLIYLRICGQDPLQSLILKSGLNLLTEWLVAMLYKLRINKKIEFEAKTQARYQANVVLEFVLKTQDSGVKNKKEYQQRIRETLLADSSLTAEILSEGFALSKLTEYLVGSLQGGCCEISQWVKSVKQIANLKLNGTSNTSENQ